MPAEELLTPCPLALIGSMWKVSRLSQSVVCFTSTHGTIISGTTAVQLTLSEHYVYALKSNGEILVRYGVTPQNILGDYWRAIPGVFQLLSGSFHLAASCSSSYPFFRNNPYPLIGSCL